MGCRPDNAEPRNGCDNATDNKAAAGHGIVPGLLQDLSRALAGDVDLKVCTGVDVDCGVTARAFAALGFGIGEVCREHLEHLLLGGTIALLD